MPTGATIARLDRLQLSAWALLRGSAGPGNLATGGTLGGSQVGALHFDNVVMGPESLLGEEGRGPGPPRAPPRGAR